MRIPILRRADYDFGVLPQETAAKPIPLQQDIDCTRFARGTLVVRVHSASLPADGGMFRVDVRATAPTSEDPAQFFRGQLVGTAVVTDTTVNTPQLICATIEQPGAAISVFLVTARGKAPAGDLKFTISVDLHLHEAGDWWTPLELGTGLKLWLDEHDLVVVGSKYSDWGDQSPAANDFTQGTATLRPAEGLTINRQLAPNFDGSDDYLASNALSSFVSASAYHVFAVINPQTISGGNATSYLNNAVIADTGAGWWGLFLKNNAGVLEALAFHWDTAERVAVGTPLTLNVDTLIETSFDGATIRCQVGADDIGTATASSIGSLTNAARIGNGAPGSLFLDGAIASIVVCNRYLTAAERVRIRAYLSSRYGVAV